MICLLRVEFDLCQRLKGPVSQEPLPTINQSDARKTILYLNIKHFLSIPIPFCSVSGPFHFYTDPFRGITDPLFFSIKNIFLQKMICFVIYELNIYVR